MSAIAVRAFDVAKRYRIGRPRVKRNLREAIVDGLRRPFRALAGSDSGSDRDEGIMWALDGISFEIGQGEVVGLIGRNGAGKSTLLKLLSRITGPTRGEIDLYGRVGSLLEVGTGFHPELTGRENVYLNGAVLGMKRAEIAGKFDEIVAFAETEKFIDTQVKHYSTGMFTRLAFSVAAHLEADILLVDEVLAVGDASFQRKCLNKMEDMGRGGRTVVFVSHSITAILRLCKRVILLDRGRIAADGEAQEVARQYLSSGEGTTAARVWPSGDQAPGDVAARLKSVRVLDDRGCVVETIDIRKPVAVEVEYFYLDAQSYERPTVILHFTNEAGICLFATNDFNNIEWWNARRTPGIVRATCHLPGNFFAEGRIFVLVAVGSYNPNVIHAIERDAISFQVADRTQGDGVRGVCVGDWPGVVRPMLQWNVGLRPVE